MKKYLLLFAAGLLMLISCSSNKNSFDATGKFEATDYIVSIGATGKLVQLNIAEGMQLQQNTVVGLVDTTQLYLKKLQTLAQMDAILIKQPDISKQLAATQEQIKTANTEKVRVQNLLQAGAATQKQLDDVNAQISVLQKQLEALQSSLDITSRGLRSEIAPLVYQIQQLDDQILKSHVLNPVNGTVLTQYVEQDEFITPAKPLYKIADLSQMILRAYITGDQLAEVTLNQPVTVSIDDGNDEFKEYAGKISWISDKAEFTPKTIQTKEERANLVYAIKIAVANDGFIKIGMYGEVTFK